jgi:hypothetical protein
LAVAIVVLHWLDIQRQDVLAADLASIAVTTAWGK